MTSKPKERSSFFRKVVNFVANPATQWGESDAPPPPQAEVPRVSAAAKSELKEMIDRKRRNDFVRKSEFDMLRKLRRDGLSSVQLADLGRGPEAADSDIFDEPVPAEDGMKLKIDEIEAEMRARPPSLAARAGNQPGRPRPPLAPTEPMGLNTKPGPASIDTTVGEFPRQHSRPVDPVPASVTATTGADSRTGAASSHFSGFGNWLPANNRGVEVREGRHDTALDAAVMAFANSDSVGCRHALRDLVEPGGERENEPGTWLVLMDYYRAVGQQSAFGSLASAYTDRFGADAPAWRPVALVDADLAASVVHWHAPEALDASAVAHLLSDEPRPTPWVLDWSDLSTLDAAACLALAEVFETWCSRRIDMRWIGANQVVSLLETAAPTGDASADRACWAARLAIMRMRQRPGAFDDIAIDYASVYDAAAPVWERAQSRVRFVDLADAGAPRHDTTIGEMTTAFVETTVTAVEGELPMAHVDMTGELVGDVSALLAEMNTQIGASTKVRISCRHLVRADFSAAGELLNWLIAKKRARVEVRFVEAHRLVALFFTSMGIDQYASVHTDNG